MRRVDSWAFPPPTRGGYMERILVVDDESDVREFAWDTLVARGYEVLEARDGEEAQAEREMKDVRRRTSSTRM
jgi:DNA-binding NtrC family response regulator